MSPNTFLLRSFSLIPTTADQIHLNSTTASRMADDDVRKLEERIARDLVKMFETIKETGAAGDGKRILDTATDLMNDIEGGKMNEGGKPAAEAEEMSLDRSGVAINGKTIPEKGCWRGRLVWKEWR